MDAAAALQALQSVAANLDDLGIARPTDIQLEVFSSQVAGLTVKPSYREMARLRRKLENQDAPAYLEAKGYNPTALIGAMAGLSIGAHLGPAAANRYVRMVMKRLSLGHEIGSPETLLFNRSDVYETHLDCMKAGWGSLPEVDPQPLATQYTRRCIMALEAIHAQFDIRMAIKKTMKQEAAKLAENAAAALQNLGGNSSSAANSNKRGRTPEPNEDQQAKRANNPPRPQICLDWLQNKCRNRPGACGKGRRSCDLTTAIFLSKRFLRGELLARTTREKKTTLKTFQKPLKNLPKFVACLLKFTTKNDLGWLVFA